MSNPFRVSGFERNANERYFTHPQYTKLLLPFIPAYVKEGIVWEPAAGRGDMARVLIEDGYNVVASDVDLTEYDFELGSAQPMDFLASEPDFEQACQYSAIITNPPYGRNLATGGYFVEEFIQKSLDHGVDYIAMFLRAEVNHAGGRRHLWEPPFAYEVVVCSRPRWDWWLPDPEPWEEDEIKKRKNGPIHVYSWFVWDRRWQGPRTTFYAKADKEP